MIKRSSTTSSPTSSLQKTQVSDIAKKTSGSVDSKLAEAAACKIMTPLQRNQAKYEAVMLSHQASLDHGPKPCTDRTLDQSICVAFRVRPMLPVESNERGLFEGIHVRNPKTFVYHPIDGVFQPAALETHCFDNIDVAFGPDADNVTVYDALARPLLPFVTNGGLATLVAYGQTGAGKTFTMSSLNAQLPQDIFPHFSDSHDATLAYFEIYGDDVCDLLNDRQKVHIRATNEATVVTGIVQHAVTSPQEYLDVVEAGAASPDALHLQKRRLTPSPGTFTPPEHLTLAGNTLLVVDLAGSERASDQAYHDAIRIRESQITNKSLMTLKECIRNRYLSSLPSHADKHIHIPFRTSKLTLVLREALDPSARVPARTILIGHLAPSLADSQHSLSTARYVANLKASGMDYAKHATVRLSSATAKFKAFRMNHAMQQTMAQLGDAVSAPKVPVHPSKWTYRQLAHKFAQWSNNSIVLDKIVPYVEIDNSFGAWMERRKRGEKPKFPAWMEIQRMALWEWVAKCKAVGVTELTATKAFDKYQVQLAMGRAQTKAKGEQLSVLIV